VLVCWSEGKSKRSAVRKVVPNQLFNFCLQSAASVWVQLVNERVNPDRRKPVRPRARASAWLLFQGTNLIREKGGGGGGGGRRRRRRRFILVQDFNVAVFVHHSVNVAGAPILGADIILICGPRRRSQEDARD